MTKQRTDPDSLAAAERAITATRLRAAGLSYAEIAAECDYNSEQAAHKAVSSLLKRRKREAGDELRELIETRLDECLFSVYDRATAGGSYAAIDRVLRIEAQRAALYEGRGKGKGKAGEGAEPERAKVTIYIPTNGRGEASEGEDGEEGGDAGGG